MALRQVSGQTARRLAIARQLLAGPRPKPTARGLLKVARQIHCIQLDPTNAVARTQLLVPFARLGSYNPAVLDQLTWKDKTLFHYWGHAASLVLTEDYPIHRRMMITWATGDGKWDRRVRDWMEANKSLRRHVLSELKRRGPLRSRDFEDKSVDAWGSSGWTDQRNVGRMLDFLWVKGRVMVAGRAGAERLWDLADRWWPEWMPRDRITEAQAVQRAVPISLRSLGVGTQKHISMHFIPGRYGNLRSTLATLERRGEIEQIEVQGDPGKWFIHREDIALAEKLERGEWEPRTVLLSPFDNLIRDRDRTEAMFDFRYRIEIYVPKNKRQYGYYSMPILHGDRLIGRLDPLFERKTNRLVINSAHAEKGTDRSRATAVAVRGAVEELGAWLGASEIEYGKVTYEPWRKVLR